MTTLQKPRTMRYVLLALLLAAALCLFNTFGPATGNMTQGSYFYLKTGSDFDGLLTELRDGGFIADRFSFGIIARAFKLPAHVRPGKYRIQRGMSNFSIARMLRNGRQEPVKLVINKVRTKQDLIHLLAANLEPDSVTWAGMMTDNVFLSQYNLDTSTVMCGILPDTYEMLWNTTADKALKKILRNYARFWDATHKAEAAKHNMSVTNIVILASIVDEETNMNDDKPKIASVYLNRLKKGMKLEADPTVKFAIGDFTVKRISGQMLQNQSAYNTYVNTGLPPGPICTPSVSSIEAVLQAPATTYLYFCAKDDFSGYSSFASSYDEQMKNAHAYQKALNERGIR